MHPAEAPAPASTTTTTVHHHPITSYEEDPLDIFLPIHPVLALPTPGPTATSVPDTTTTATSDSLIPQDGTGAEDDEDEIWLAMAMTFNDLYQGLTEDNIPSPEEADNTTDPTDNNSNAVIFGHNEEGNNRLSTPFHHGFRRVIEIDHAGDKTISYVAPDGFRKLMSHEETGRF